MAAEIVTANPTRYGGFATLRMQDTATAAAELDRCGALGVPVYLHPRPPASSSR